MIDKGFTISIPSHGYVRYIDHMGSDTRIVEAARVSFGAGSKGEELDKKLLRYMFTHRHTSPFEQGIIAFNIKMPVFVMRQLVRHRTFRLNEFSGRYSEMPDEFYMPNLWRVQDQANKQGSNPPPPNREQQKWHEGNSSILQDAYSVAYLDYKALLKRGVAKEMARMLLPVGIYTEIYMNVDLHNLMHFFYLRTDSHAQKEIRDIAWAMVQIAEQLFPWSIALWDEFKPEMVKRGLTASVSGEKAPDKCGRCAGELRGDFAHKETGKFKCADQLPKPRDVCILDCDSPTLPPSNQERMQCGCVKCREDLNETKTHTQTTN